MPYLTKKLTIMDLRTYECTDGRTDPYYRIASLLKTKISQNTAYAKIQGHRYILN